jgi:hypothetical protein
VRLSDDSEGIIVTGLILQELLKQKPKVRFVTANDGDVDPQLCRPLHDTLYDIDDPNIPQPPLHRHCRCTLVPEFNQ